MWGKGFLLVMTMAMPGEKEGYEWWCSAFGNARSSIEQSGLRESHQLAE
jgi:hypothetical protein